MSKQKKTLLTPTEAQFTALNEAYKYFNTALFNGILPGCFLNFSRNRKSHGFFAPERWRRVGDEQYFTHEISLTPTTLYREPKEVFSTLVHEQVHLWQWEFANSSRKGYHNKEWADKMEEIGLMPSSTGSPGGKRTGQNMSHYIIKGGKYELAFEKMPKKFILPFTSLDGDIMKSLISGKSGPDTEGKITTTTKGKSPRKKGYKVKYSCLECKINVWGKSELSLRCNNCDEDLAENE